MTVTARHVFDIKELGLLKALQFSTAVLAYNFCHPNRKDFFPQKPYKSLKEYNKLNLFANEGPTVYTCR